MKSNISTKSKLIIVFLLLNTLILFSACKTNTDKDESINNDFHELEELTQFVSGTLSQEFDYLTYSSWDTLVFVYDLKAKAIIFQEKVNDICYAKPTLNTKKDQIFFPNASNEFSCYDLSTKKRKWVTKLKGKKCSNFALIHDKIIITSLNGYGIVALDAASGEILHENLYHYDTCNSPDLSPWSFDFDDEFFYVSNWECNIISAFTIYNGELIWQKTLDEIHYAGNPIVTGNYIFLGLNKFYEGGKIILLDKTTGEIIYEKSSNYEERCIARLLNEQIFYYTYDMKLNVFDVQTKTTTVFKELNPKNDLSGSQMYLVNNSLIYSDASYGVNQINTIDLEVTKVGELISGVIFAFEWDDKTFIVR